MVCGDRFYQLTSNCLGVQASCAAGRARTGRPTRCRPRTCALRAPRLPARPAQVLLPLGMPALRLPLRCRRPERPLRALGLARQSVRASRAHRRRGRRPRRWWPGRWRRAPARSMRPRLLRAARQPRRLCSWSLRAPARTRPLRLLRRPAALRVYLQSEANLRVVLRISLRGARATAASAPALSPGLEQHAGPRRERLLCLVQRQGYHQGLSPRRPRGGRPTAASRRAWWRCRCRVQRPRR